MAWSEAEVVCRRHPNETPQPGVCPSCLRDRLSRIAGNSRTNRASSSSPSVSAFPVYYYYYSSASSSGCSSPANRHRLHQRVASDIMESIYFAISGNINGLKKSRSMVCAPRNGARDGVNSKKKGGFWNKLLLRSSGKKTKFWWSSFSFFFIYFLSFFIIKNLSLCTTKISFLNGSDEPIRICIIWSSVMDCTHSRLLQGFKVWIRIKQDFSYVDSKSDKRGGTISVLLVNCYVFRLVPYLLWQMRTYA